MRFYAIFVLVINLCTLPTASAETWKPLDVARRYDMFWGGMKVGYMAAEIRQNDKGIYRFEVRIKSKGLLEWVSQYQSTTVSTFKFDKGNIIPISFTSDGYLRKKHSSTLLGYNAKGLVIKEEITPPKRSWKNKEVPENMLRSAQNPLTGAVMSRELIKHFIEKGYEKGRFSVSIYDGKRLGDYRFSVLGNRKISINDKNLDVYAMRFTRKSLAGFSDREITKLKEEPIIYVYFSNDDTLLPLKSEAKVPYGGSAVVLFDRDCDSIEQCLN